MLAGAGPLDEIMDPVVALEALMILEEWRLWGSWGHRRAKRWIWGMAWTWHWW